MSDNYRPRQDSRRSTRRQDMQPAQSSSMGTQGQRNVSGGRPPQSDFTYRPSDDTPKFMAYNQAAEVNYGRPRSGKNIKNRRPQPRRNGTYRRDFPIAASDPSRYGNRIPFPHERALLQTGPENAISPAPLAGLPSAPQRFPVVPVGESSKDHSRKGSHVNKDDSRAGSGTGSVAHKRIRTAEHTLNVNDLSTPKWSNPASSDSLFLPPPGASKTLSLIDQIRAEKEKRVNAPAQGSTELADNSDYVALDSSQGQESSTVLGSLNELPVTTDMDTLGVRGPSLSAQQHHKRKRIEGDSAVVAKWLVKTEYDNATPWVRSYGHQDMTQWLHNEIIDFYEYVKPRDNEITIRDNLCSRVEACLRDFYGPQFSIHAFGSFPAGLFLPDADMDLAFVSWRFEQDEAPVLKWRTPKQIKFIMEKAGDQLVQHGVCRDYATVHKAKVPILKFIDTQTNLRVDLSFENLNGTLAQISFRSWTKEYEHMPMLVALFKQYLVMREWNEVHTGGIGGYSTVCLVVSFLQLHSPGDKNLGELFLEFLDFYGNKFDLNGCMISLNPPEYARKNPVGGHGIDGKRIVADRLSIRDPDNPRNDISGGSRHAGAILKSFQGAYRALIDRIEWLDANRDADTQRCSILEPILGGDYSTYVRQRNLLRGFSRYGKDSCDG